MANSTYALIPAEEQHVSKICEINHAYSPSESLLENVKRTADKDQGLLVEKYDPKYVKEHLLNFLAIIKPPAEVVGYLEVARNSRGSLLEPEEFDGKKYEWHDTSLQHIIGSPYKTPHENSPYKDHHMECIWIKEACVDLAYQKQSAARAAYEILFKNPNLALPWGTTDKNDCKPITAKEVVFFAFVVRKPVDNGRSLRFHLRNGFTTKVLTYNNALHDYDLDGFQSEMYAKVVKY